MGKSIENGGVLLLMFFLHVLTLPAWAQIPPVFGAQPNHQVALAGSNAMFNVSVSTPGPLRYQWRYNGTNIPNIILTVAGGGSRYATNGSPATNVDTLGVMSVAVDGAGNLYTGYTSGGLNVVDAQGNMHFSVVSNNNRAYGDTPVALDPAGRLIFADSGNSRVYRLNTNGSLTLIAGSLNYGYSGDGGPATNAMLYNPVALAVDKLGNVFIADSYNSRIRKVDTNGIISTIAGGGTTTPKQGNTATNVAVYQPSCVVADDAGNVYSIDVYYGDPVYKVGASGLIDIVTNTQGTTPRALALDALGNLFIADSYNYYIYKLDPRGVRTIVAGNGSSGFSGDGGPATSAMLNGPRALAVDAAGNLFIADTTRVRKIPAHGPTWTIGQVTATNAGNYDVVVGNSYGSVTSHVAGLNVVFPTSPAMQTVLVGQTANFSIGALGPIPLSYQWYAVTNGQVAAILLPGQTNSVLNLPVGSLGDAGTYFAVVGNGFGGVVSTMASLTVKLPTILHAGLNGTAKPVLQLTGSPGAQYVLQVATNLAPPVYWQSVVTNTADTNGNWSFTDTKTSGRQRYYRVAVP